MVKDDRTTAVLFDLEDTLVQTLWQDKQYIIKFRRQTKRKLIELGIPPSILEGVERAVIMRNKALEYIVKNFSEPKAQKFCQELEKFLKRYELHSAKKSKLFPETVSALEELKKLNVKMGLITNTSREAVDAVFKLHDLKKYFDVIITRENVKKLKPNPQGVLLAIRKLGAKNFFMVGDLDYDALAAKNANGISIIVKRNLQNESDFHADYFVQSLSEVPTIIQAVERTTAKKVKI